jgi:hypothetical protein
MITVNLQSGGTYSIEENIVANIKSNSGGCEIVVVEAEQLRSIFSSQSPATVAGLSPYFLSLTNIQRAEVVATIGYSGLSNTVDFVFNIGAGRWSKLTDNGTNSLTAVAQLVQNITVGQAITSDTGFAKVSSVSYTYPSNTIYLNALRIKDVTALGFYGGSLVKYDEGGADFAEYEVGIAPATLVTQINATGGGGGMWSQSGNSLYPTTLTDDVGIGTNSPLSRLHVVGGSLGSENTNQLNGIYFNFAGGGGQILYVGSVITDYNGFEIYDNDNVITGRDLVTGSLLRLVANDGLGAFAERVTFLNNGNVGINNTAPTEILDVDGNIQLTGALITVPQYATPLTGTTVTSDGSQQLVINPAGTLLALTVAFPATPVDGQRFDISCTQIITGLTLTSAATILGTLTTFAAANAFAGWVYSATAASWVRQH